MGMNREQYIEYHKAACDKMVEITRKKNHDYSRSDDPFANFKIVGALGLSVEQGFITRMSDKLSRISNFTIQRKLLVEDESVEDTLFDLANYCLLMAGYLKSERIALEEKHAQQMKILQSEDREVVTERVDELKAMSHAGAEIKI
jgi:hypothetical protein